MYLFAVRAKKLLLVFTLNGPPVEIIQVQLQLQLYYT